MSVQRIHHYSISAPAKILSQMVDFYSDILGLENGDRPDFGVPGYWLYAQNEPILHLIEDSNRAGNAKGYFDHIALRCDHIDAVRSRLDAREVPYTEFTVSDVGQTQIVITDPAENSVELNFLVEA